MKRLAASLRTPNEGDCEYVITSEQRDIRDEHRGRRATAAVLGQMAHAQGSDRVKVGMLGCGGRGRGAMQNCLDADPGVEIIALADLFASQAKARATNS